MQGLHIQKNKIAVIGFGVSGVSVAKYFLKQGVGIDIFEDKKESDFEHARLSEFQSYSNFRIFFSDSIYDLDTTIYDYIIASPGVHLDHKIILSAQANNIEYITDINAFSRIFRVKYPKGTIISITGSNGKSTTVTLLYEVLKKIKEDVYLGGNIGISPLEYLENIKTDFPIIILETSSYQLEYMKSEDYFDIACILNLSDNHLDRYHGKKELYALAKLGGINFSKTQILINHDDEYTKKYIMPHIKSKHVIGIDFEHIQNNHVVSFENNSIFYIENNLKKTYISDIRKMKIRGLHNVYNTAFVCGILHVLKVNSSESLEDLFYIFGGLEHRIQSVGIFNGVEYVNDSKSTSPDATIKALEALGRQKNIVLISGGMDKGISYESMNTSWDLYVKSVVFLPGNANDKLKKLAEDTRTINLGEFKTMQEVVRVAHDNSIKGDIVLLSPSTASFASFSSFEDRGNQFISCVKNLFVDTV